MSLGLAIWTLSGAGGGGDGDRCRAGGGGARGQTGSGGGGGLAFLLLRAGALVARGLGRLAFASGRFFFFLRRLRCCFRATGIGILASTSGAGTRASTEG